MVMMLKPQPYYYEDIVFQLELNLQSIRRELIKLLDEYPNKECYLCNRLQCRCFSYKSFSTVSFESCHNSDLDSGIFDFKSPPADLLPIPDWKINSLLEFETWIRNSIADFSLHKSMNYPISKNVMNKMNLIWPPFPMSVWSSEYKTEKEKQDEINMCKKERNTVNEFFMYFKNKHEGLYKMNRSSHPLLEPATPCYSNATVRRAFIVWMHCGQKNTFKGVCDYYHHLEKLENTLSADYRAKSRFYEFNMFNKPPPTSPFLQETFPNLYSQSVTIQNYIKKVETYKNNATFQRDAAEISQLELAALAKYNGEGKQEIYETSQMIKQYCKTYMKPVHKFIEEFNQYATKCELKCTVNNVAFYIKRKMLEEELQMEANYTRALSFLDLIEAENKTNLDAMKRPNDQLYWKGLANISGSNRNSVTRN